MCNSYSYYPAVSQWKHCSDADTLDGAKQYTLKNVHGHRQCGGRVCIIHKPTGHHMRDWPLLWRDDRNIWERICLHGVGHPDPDQIPYWEESNQSWQTIHGCCGCCNGTVTLQ